jgi:uncharacterized delta-60 repeat protein
MKILSNQFLVATGYLILLVIKAQAAVFWTESGTGKIRVYDNAESRDVITGLSYVSGIAVDSDNQKIYWTDRGIGSIQSANFDGTEIETLVSSDNYDAFGIALDVPGRKIYWADAYLNVIKRANLDGSNVEVIVNTTGDPEGILVDSLNEKVYWSTFISAEIYVADLDGSNVTKLISSPNLYALEGIALNRSAGKLYFCDYGSGIIYEANLDGTDINPLINGLNAPIGVAYDSVRNKLLWVSQNDGLLQESDIDGQNVTTLASTNFPKGLAIAVPAVPRLYVVDYYADNIYEVDYETGQQSVIPDTYNLYGPTEIVTSPSGRVFIANLHGDEILEFDYTNNSVQTFAHSIYLEAPDEGSPNESLDGPIGIDFDSDGNLIVANKYGNSIIRIDLETQEQSLISRGGLLTEPFDVAVDKDGNFLVTNGPSRSVVKIDRISGTQSTLSSNGFFSFPDDIIVLRDGRILVSDSINGQVIKIIPDDGSQEIVAYGGFLNSPNSLTEAIDGSLIVADGQSGIIRIDLDAETESAQTLISEDGLFISPEGATLVYAPRPNYYARFNDDVLTLVEGSSVYAEIAVNYGNSTDNPEESEPTSQIYDPARLEFSMEADDPSWITGISYDKDLLVFPGDNYASVSIYLPDDMVLNEARTIRLRMTSLTPGLTVQGNEFVTINLQDDDVPSTVFFEGSRAVLHEAQGDLALTLKRYVNDPGSLSVHVRTVDGTAEAGRDYQPLDTMVTFEEGVYEKTIAIGGPPVTAEINPIREFTVELYNPSEGALLGEPNVFTITVNDRDDPGSLDTTFSIPEKYSEGSKILSILPDGRTLALLYDGSDYRPHMFFSDGSLDESFNYFKGSQYSYTLRDAAPLPGGRIILAGRSLGLNEGSFFTDDLVIINTDGTPDSSFNYQDALENGAASAGAVCPQPDGKFLVGGLLTCNSPSRAFIDRVNSDGFQDTSFHSPTISGGACPWVNDIKILPNGKILIAGNYTRVNGHPGPIVRLNPDGTVDTSFTCSLPTNSISQIVVQPDGKILLYAHPSSLYSGNNGVYRLNSDGSADSSFQPFTDGSKYDLYSSNPISLALLPNGQILIAVQVRELSTNESWTIVRLNADGTLDSSFSCISLDKYRSFVRDFALAEDGSIYVTGSFTTLDGHDLDGGLARLIQPDIQSVGQINFDQTQVLGAEGEGQLIFPVTRSGSGSGKVSVSYNLILNSSAETDDLNEIYGSLVFEDTETSKYLTVPVINDGITEGPETFELVLHSVAGGVHAGNYLTSTGTITDSSLTYMEWRQLHYGSSTSPEGDPEYNPESSIWNNLQHYTFGTDPWATNLFDYRQPIGFLSTAPDQGSVDYLQIYLFYNTASPQVRIDVESSTDLKNWISIWNSEDDPNFQSPLVVQKALGESDWVTIRDNDNINNFPKRFLRVRSSLKK